MRLHEVQVHEGSLPLSVALPSEGPLGVGKCEMEQRTDVKKAERRYGPALRNTYSLMTGRPGYATVFRCLTKVSLLMEILCLASIHLAKWQLSILQQQT